MALYEYVDTQGKLKTIEASSPSEAMSRAQNIARNSGVSLASGAGTGSTPQSGTRNLMLSSGSPASSLMQTSAASSQVAQTADPYTIFNQQLMQMLSRQQTMGTKRFAEQGFKAQEEQNKRILAKTPNDLIGAAPGVQSGVRSASAGALDPTISQASRAQQTFSEQIQGFGNAIESAKGLLATVQAQEDKKRDDARAVIKDALTLGGADSLNGLAPEELKQLEKLAGYPAGYVSGLAQTIKERELQLKQEAAAARGTGPANLTASQQTALDNVNTVVQSLSDYRTLYNELVEEDGTQLTGTEAAQLAGAYNALMFQIAQASGTGALQAADRQVVEAMVPNPTTIAGAGRAWLRGGKQGGLDAIDQASKIMQNKKSAITASGSTGGGITVTTPNGSVYSFDSQEAADAFRRQIGQ